MTCDCWGSFLSPADIGPVKRSQECYSSRGNCQLSVCGCWKTQGSRHLFQRDLACPHPNHRLLCFPLAGNMKFPFTGLVTGQKFGRIPFNFWKGSNPICLLNLQHLFQGQELAQWMWLFSECRMSQWILRQYGVVVGVCELGHNVLGSDASSAVGFEGWSWTRPSLWT